MELIEKEIQIAKSTIGTGSIINDFKSQILQQLNENEIPIRFVITKTDNEFYYCELGLLIQDYLQQSSIPFNSIFNHQIKSHESTDKFNAVLLIPTGIGAVIGGHCGDGNVIARLIASACDTLITHPNVVNASDINEMTENTLYVEGSILTRFMMGQIGLSKVRSNRLLMLMDKHKDTVLNNEVVNAVSSARVTLGLDCDVIEMNDVIKSTSVYSASGRATGHIEQLERLYDIVNQYQKDYDAIALATRIIVPESYHFDYYKQEDMVNPWGGVESMLTHTIATEFNIPAAHSPLQYSMQMWYDAFDARGIIDPRKAPETASITYLHCILKGLHKTPKIVNYQDGLNLKDVSCLIIPDGCLGLPVLSAIENNIPVIAVRENKNEMKNDLASLPFRKDKLFIVDTYLESVGVMHLIKAGLSLDTIKRPITWTKYNH